MTKTLYLLRHAKSSRESPTSSDHDRQLAPRGRRASQHMAEHLRAQGIAPDIVLCSSASRTQETLELIRAGFSREVRVEIEPGLYGAGTGELLERVRTVGRDVESVMLIGHNPGMQQLTVSLAGHGKRLDAVRGKFPTAALATLTFAGSWDELAPKAAELVAFVRPRDLESD